VRDAENGTSGSERTFAAGRLKGSNAGLFCRSAFTL